MALRLLWSDPARASLRRILDYIGAEDEAAALRLKARIDQMILPVLEHPYIFRAGRISGTREIVIHPNYVVIYKVADEHIEIVRVLHTRQQYPKST